MLRSIGTWNAVRMRHSSLTLKWIGRRRRSLPLLTVGLLVRAQVPAPAVSVYSDVPGTSFDDSDRGDCPHQPEAGVLEGAIAAPRGLVKVRASHVAETAKRGAASLVAAQAWASPLRV